MARNLRSLSTQIPTLLAFVGLVTVGVWGHRTGWKLAPRVETAAAEDWCEAHNVPDSRCLACHPELGGGDARDWCREHGVPESKCTVCHPEILTSGKADDWCREHGVPESQCTTCHPEVAVQSQLPPDPNAPTVTTEGAPDPRATCQTHLVRVQFASPEAVRKAGVELTPVVRRAIADTVPAYGEVRYDATRLARLAARADGTVWRVVAQPGGHVAEGQLLALIDAAEVGRAKAEFLAARAQLDVRQRALRRLEGSAQGGVVVQGVLEEAEAVAREASVRLFNAEQALANLGLIVSAAELQALPDREAAERLRFAGISPEEATAHVGSATTSANLVAIRAPFEGTVIAREAVQGEVVERNQVIVTVADLSRLWLELSVAPEDQERVAIGQAVAFHMDGTGVSARGAVSWVSTALDETTRTLPVRAVVENPDGRLRASAFGGARITTRAEPEAVVVPEEAVHWEGCCHVVFVRLTDDIFQTRKVQLGARASGMVEVVIGLVPGEAVAARGSHVLKSELLKSRLGAGCVDD